MQRTNIYLEERQCQDLDRLARSQGVSRSQLVRQLIDRALDAVGDDLGEGLAAIDQSFGVLAGEGALVSRGPDARSAYLGRMVDG